MKFKFLIPLIFLCQFGIAQSVSKQIKKAEDNIKNLSYASAIELYEGVLKKNKLSAEELQKVKLRLAESYFFVKDYKNAERYYAEILLNNPSLKGDEIKAYQRFAQVLSSNGNYQESTKMWIKHQELQEQDKRGLEFAKLYKNLESLTRNAESYNIEYVGINTNNPEFSPTFYKNGLVFVSSRNSNNSVKRVFKWDNSSFLDLYYLEDLKVLGKDASSGALGNGDNISSALPRKNTEKLGSDYYTPPTSNDANTIAHQGSDFITGSKNYEENAIIPVKSFSKKLNSKYHEGPCSFYDNGEKIIFTRNGDGGGDGIFGQKKGDVSRLKLYSAARKGSDWAGIKELPFNDDKYSCGHPSMSADNKTLFFVSDMPGGYGGTDIWYTVVENGNWSTPINLGGKINTVGNEMFPFIDEVNNLYFSSDGHPGFGDMDIFTLKLDNNTLKPASIIRNLGAPINSKNDDFGIITNASRTFGYFSSNRKRGGSDDDIWKFTRVGNLYGCRDLIVSVFDKTTKLPLDQFKFYYTKNGQENNQDAATTNEAGTSKICLEADKDFEFTFEKSGYKTITKAYTNINDSDFEASSLDIYIEKENPTPVAAVKSPEKKQRSLIQRRSTGGDATVFRGVISGGENNEPISAVKVKFINKCNGDIQEVYTKKDGSYEFKRNLECDYELLASKDDFGVSSEIIEKAIVRTLFRKKIKPNYVLNLFDTKLYKVGDIIKLENIYYDSESFKIRENAKKDLDKLANTLLRYPNMIVEISSHTDTRGASIVNLQLSQKRANEVFKYMVSRDVPKARLRAVGKGELEPLNKCGDGVQCTEAEHQRNRRTEFKILRIEKI